VRLVRVLEGQNIEPESPSIPATRAIHSALTFIDIAVEELKPRYMRGYGEIPAAAAAELNGIVRELSTLVQQLDRYVTQSGQDLKQRLAQLECAGAEVELLNDLERIISEHGLVEFRSALAMVLSRLEDTSFEIAVFGRVSSGKSSLLNAILETEILPVGVTPITTVPTRIVYGDAPGLIVCFPNRAPERYDISLLGEFASEQHNPGNTKHVTRIVVQFPSAWLKDGVSFVDTPGLGSLATTGAAETMAYLPRCDLGVVLIDAGTALSTNDLQTIDALYQAGIPAQVLLSKADLLAPQDLDRVLTYTTEHLASEVGISLAVHPVSVMSAHRELLTHWVTQEIVPLFGRCQELRAASVRRKVGALRQAAEAALRSRLRHSEQIPAGTGIDTRSLDANLRKTTARFEEANETSNRIAGSLPALEQSVFMRSAQRLVPLDSKHQDGAEAVAVVRTAAMEAVQEQARFLQQTLDALAGELAKVLDAVAQSINTVNRPSEQEFHLLVRGMPVLDLGFLQVAEARPALTAWLGERLATRLLAWWLTKQLQPQMATALTVYGRLLRDWSSGVLGQMQRRFAAYADAYRAQAERSATSSDMPAEERRALQRDIELLATFAPAEAPAPARHAS
jgi:GTP-binding protein EngB required for normal cell division/NTP pyrophosphatase (non-canonical NTP hydrolase)